YLSARASQRGFSGNKLGAISRGDDDGSSSYGAAQRSRLPRRRNRLRMVEWRMGSGGVSERALCSRVDRADGATHFDCAFHVATDPYHGVGAVFAFAGTGRLTLRPDGFSTR